MKNFRDFSRRGKIICLIWLGISLIGLAVAVAGGVCIEIYGEEAFVPNMILLGGVILIIVSAVGIVISGLIESKRCERRDESRAAAISADTYYAGGILVTFTETGMRIKQEEVEPFEEGETVVPYEDVTIYRTLERRRPKSKGRSLCVLKIPVRYLWADAPDDEDAVASCALDESERLEATLNKFAVRTKDCRAYPSATSRKLPLKPFRGNSRLAWKIICSILAVLFLGLLVLAAVCWAGLTEGGVEGGYIVLGADVFLTGVLLLCAYFGTRKLCILYDRGFRVISGNTNSAFFLWEQVEKIKKIETEKEAYVLFDFGYMEFSFPDRRDLYLFLKETFPEKCGE